MWAGVQKVSRPMERCQETSQAPPMLEKVTAAAPVQIYQGMPARDEAAWGTADGGRSVSEVNTGG